MIIIRPNEEWILKPVLDLYMWNISGDVDDILL